MESLRANGANGGRQKRTNCSGWKGQGRVPLKAATHVCRCPASKQHGDLGTGRRGRAAQPTRLILALTGTCVVCAIMYIYTYTCVYIQASGLWSLEADAGDFLDCSPRYRQGLPAGPRAHRFSHLATQL